MGVILVDCSLSLVTGKDGGYPNENVDGVQVNADTGVDWVEGGSPIAGRRVALSLVNNFLGFPHPSAIIGGRNIMLMLAQKKTP